MQFPGSNQSAPAVKAGGDYQLPEGNQWRYSEFINAVQSGKVERVRFSKEGGQLQVQDTLAGLTICIEPEQINTYVLQESISQPPFCLPHIEGVGAVRDGGAVFA